MLEHLDHCPMCVKLLADEVRGKRQPRSIRVEMALPLPASLAFRFVFLYVGEVKRDKVKGA